MILHTGCCLASDGIHLYVIGGNWRGIDDIKDSIYRYTPPTSGNFESNNHDDIWILMGNMRYKMGFRGCTTDKSSRVLYLISGWNSRRDILI